MDNELAKYRLALMEEEVNEKTMLVVDDMEINRASLESIFETDTVSCRQEMGKKHFVF